MTSSVSPEQLLEATFATRARRLLPPELHAETLVSLVFAVLCAGLLVAEPGSVRIDAAVLALMPAYALASVVAFPLGAGYLVPTQPFLVVFFVVASPAAVPLLVLGALAGATLVGVLRQRSHPERLLFAGGDAMHALGPAAVLIAFGIGGPGELTPVVIALAFAAQLLADLACSVAREWWGQRVRPVLQAQVIGMVAAVDAALLPVGLLAGYAVDVSSLAALALLPLVALLGEAARRSAVAIGRATDRLAALERERGRLRVAVRRIGQAFASNLDLDALLQIVTRASVDALDACCGQAGSFAGDGRAVVRRATIGTRDRPAALLDAAELEALGADGPREVRGGDFVALGCRIVAGRAVAGVVVVGRRGAGFDADERALLAELCEQAGVAAANVVRHEQLHRQALTDELTGLANHRRFQELLGAAVARYERTGAPASIVLMDIDDFKAINDTYGHHVGDQVLRAVGRAVREACRTADDPARYGGEELAVVLPEGTLSTATDCAERIRSALDELPLVAHGEPLRVTASFGVAQLGGSTQTKAALLAAADNALYRAKAAGKDRVEPADGGGSPVSSSGRRVRSAAEADLRRALDAGELFVEYQPIVRLATGGVAGMEALVRWRHPVRGILPPSEFVPLAERRGLISPLGEWVLHEACRQAAEWAPLAPGLTMSVNISLPQLADDGFPAQVEAALAGAGLPADSLMLELTESVLVHDVDHAVDRLRHVRELGTRIAIDDFGTGHSSLQYLLRLPLDVVKVPRTFVEGIDGAAGERILARSVVDLGHRLGLSVVAEGVERRTQLRQLEDSGCELGQGFLFGASAPAEAVARQLAELDPHPVHLA